MDSEPDLQLTSKGFAIKMLSKSDVKELRASLHVIASALAACNTLNKVESTRTDVQGGLTMQKMATRSQLRYFPHDAGSSLSDLERAAASAARILSRVMPHSDALSGEGHLMVHELLDAFYYSPPSSIPALRTRTRVVSASSSKMHLASKCKATVSGDASSLDPTRWPFRGRQLGARPRAPIVSDRSPHTGALSFTNASQMQLRWLRSRKNAPT